MNVLWFVDLRHTCALDLAETKVPGLDSFNDVYIGYEYRQQNERNSVLKSYLLQVWVWASYMEAVEGYCDCGTEGQVIFLFC